MALKDSAHSIVHGQQQLFKPYFAINGIRGHFQIPSSQIHFVFVKSVGVCRLQQECQLGRNDHQPNASPGGRSENLWCNVDRQRIQQQYWLFRRQMWPQHMPQNSHDLDHQVSVYPCRLSADYEHVLQQMLLDMSLHMQRQHFFVPTNDVR
jgi:hypothetical protein